MHKKQFLNISEAFRKLSEIYDYISKHLKFIFNSLLSVWKCDETLPLVCDILRKKQFDFT